jgi:hypothetical protein
MARNNKRRQRLLQSAQPECTCDLRHDLDPPRHADHESTCDLWALEDFMNGILDWDPRTQKLVTLYPDTYDVDPFDDALWADDDLPLSDMQAIIDATVGGMASLPSDAGHWDKYLSCRHNMTEVVLGDGTKVYCSGAADCRGRINRPDFAVYLYGGWTASSIATFVPWEDYGTPYVPWRQVRAVIEDWFARAKSGQRVEVGCMGGHGRTGTFLACAALLADPNLTPEGAIAWVRANYCTKAVEDASQHHFVAWFADPSLDAFYTRPAPKVTPAAPRSGGCIWTKKGKGCNKGPDHAGPHHYTLAIGTGFVASAAVAGVATEPDATRCPHLLMDGKGNAISGGTFQCHKAIGHADYHSYRNVSVVTA